MKHHEFASLFPMLPDAELQSLADDIRENGLQTPIVTLDDSILDGRNRHRACEIAGVDPIFEEYLGGDPLGFVVSHNLHRRHLTEQQRAMIADKLANLSHGGKGGTRINTGIPVLTQPQAASMLNVSKDSVQQARRIRRDGVPELAAAVMSGGVSLAAAVDVAKLPADEQVAIVEQGPDAVKAKAKEIRQNAPKSESRINYEPEDALNIWAAAKCVLDRILPNDKQRLDALNLASDYIQARIKNNK